MLPFIIFREIFNFAAEIFIFMGFCFFILIYFLIFFFIFWIIWYSIRNTALPNIILDPNKEIYN